MRTPRSATLTVAACLCSGTAAFAGVLRVSATAPGPAHDGLTWQTAYLTPVAALNAAQSGDEVWIAAGRYATGFTLPPNISLYGGFAGSELARDARAPKTNVTTLTFGKESLTFGAGAPPTTVVDGFTFGFDQSNTGQIAINCVNASPTISNNTTGDFTYGYFASCSGGAPVLSGNVIGPGGGNISLANGCAAVLSGNTFSGITNVVLSVSKSPALIRNNVFRSVGSALNGGAIGVSGMPGPIIEANSFVGCGAKFGGAVYAGGSDPLIANNLMFADHAMDSGGAVYLAGSGRVLNNTIISAESPFGMAIVASRASASTTATVTISNNIVTNSSGAVANDATLPATLKLTSNCVWNNNGPDYSGLSDPTGSNGNLRGDPVLADALRGSAHIQPTSPCINAGDDSVATADRGDIDGQPRIVGAHVDIGADESNGTIWPEVPRVICVAVSGNDENSGASWAAPKKTIQAAVDEAEQRGGGDVWIASGVYTEVVTVKGAIRLYGGFSGNENSPDQRQATAGETVIEAPGPYDYGIFGNQNLATLTVDGVSIRQSPQGISASDTEVVINNCSISGCTYGAALNLVTCDADVELSDISDNSIASNPAMEVVFSSLTLIDSILARNRSTYAVNGAAGVIDCFGVSLNVSRNTISDNLGNRYGGLSMNDCQGTVDGNVFSGNQSGAAADIYSTLGQLQITNNLITGSSAPDGAAVQLDALSYDQVLNNTIVNNRNTPDQSDYPFETDGIRFTPSFYYDYGATPPTIGNNIIAFNGGAGLSVTNGYNAPAKNIIPIRWNNDIYGNGRNTTGVPDAAGTQGNITADPRFVNAPANNYRPDLGSPCVDAGSDGYVFSGETDLAGFPRILGPHSDMGAYEQPAATKQLPVAHKTPVHF